MSHSATGWASGTFMAYPRFPEPIAPSPMNPTATRSLAPFTLPVKRNVVKAAAAVVSTWRRVAFVESIVNRLPPVHNSSSEKYGDLAIFPTPYRWAPRTSSRDPGRTAVVLHYLAGEWGTLSRDPRFIDALPGHLPPHSATQARLGSCPTDNEAMLHRSP